MHKIADEKHNIASRKPSGSRVFAWIYRHRFIASFILSALVFVAGIWFGATFMVRPFGLGRVTVEESHTVRELLEKRASSPLFSRERFNDLWTILSQNMKVFIILMVGILTLGVTSLFQLGVAGIWTGAHVASVAFSGAGLPLGTIVWFLIPHGIFELLGFWIAGSLGFRGLIVFIRFLRGEGELLEKEELKRFYKLAVLSAFLLVLAAYVEAFITPAIGGMFL